MPFLGNSGQLSHIFVTSSRGEDSGNGDKSVTLDGAVAASDFKVGSSSKTNISPTLQAVTEASNATSLHVKFLNTDVSLTASGKIVANSFEGSGGNITSLDPLNLSGTIPLEKFGTNIITGAKIAENTISAANYGNSSVTTPKLSDGAVTEIKLGTSSVSTDKIVDGAITSNKLRDDGITTVKIANNMITTPKIADISVTQDKITDSAISTPKIADEAVTTAKLQNSAVTTSKITSLAVTGAKISDNAITTVKIADRSITEEKFAVGAIATAFIDNNAISTQKIIDGAVTGAKIANATINSTHVAVGSIALDRLESASLTLGLLNDNSLSGSKLERHAVTGGDSTLTGNSRSEIALLTIHNDNIRNGTISVTKLANDVTLQKIIERGSTASNVISISNVTAASSTTTGALIVTGGVGVSGNVHATKFIGDGSGLTNVPTTLQSVTSGSGNSTTNQITISNSTATSSKTTGALIVTGGVGVGGDVQATNFIGDGSGLTNVPTTLQAVTSGGGNSTSNKIAISNSTAASSKTTGALTVAGGVGVSGNVHATKFIGDGSSLSGLSSNLHQVTGGSGNSTTNKILMTNTEDTVASPSGALQVRNGGLYVAKNIKTDKDLIVTGNLTVNGTTSTFNSTTLTVEDSLITVGKGNVSGTKDIGLIFEKPNSNVAIFYDTSASKLRICGSDNFSGDVVTTNSTGIPVEITGSLTSTQSVTCQTSAIQSTTDAASNQTGALVVQNGGLYVKKKIYAGDDITAFSDRRKKSNITRIENALDKVCQLSGYTFDYLNERKTGVIAQEVKEVLPEAVYGSEDTSYSVAYGNLAGIIIEAIKELKNEIQEMKNN
jgi:hypothetical protein